MEILAARHHEGVIGTPSENFPLSQGAHDPLTPEGQIEQWGLIADGLKYNHAGRRRAARMLGGLVALIVLGTFLLFILT